MIVNIDGSQGGYLEMFFDGVQYLERYNYSYKIPIDGAITPDLTHCLLF